MNGEHKKPVESRTEDQMIGRSLKASRSYVFVLIEAVKHLYVGQRPCTGDATACGIKIDGPPKWAQRATALPSSRYCRECERVAKDAT